MKRTKQEYVTARDEQINPDQAALAIGHQFVTTMERARHSEGAIGESQLPWTYLTDSAPVEAIFGMKV